MEGTLTPQEPVGSRADVIRFVVFLVLGWVLVLLAIGLLELWLDPDLENRIGEVLDIASVVVAALGIVLVPIAVAAFARARELSWRRAGSIAAIALIAYLGGVAVDLMIYSALEGR